MIAIYVMFILAFLFIFWLVNKLVKTAPFPLLRKCIRAVLKTDIAIVSGGIGIGLGALVGYLVSNAAAAKGADEAVGYVATVVIAIFCWPSLALACFKILNEPAAYPWQGVPLRWGVAIGHAVVFQKLNTLAFEQFLPDAMPHILKVAVIDVGVAIAMGIIFWLGRDDTQMYFENNEKKKIYEKWQTEAKQKRAKKAADRKDRKIERAVVSAAKTGPAKTEIAGDYEGKERVENGDAMF